MNKFYLKSILIILTTFWFSVVQGQIVMTTSKKGDIGISIAGSGTITIDWGDDTPKETHNLIAYNEEKDFALFTIVPTDYGHRHPYSDTSSRKITITGGAVTHLKVAFISLTSLDVSNSVELLQLFCGGNYLTSLDINKNTELTHLATNATQITSLDLSNNPNLIYLNSVGNRLKYLDVSNNPKLTHLLLYNNQLKNLDVSKNVELKKIDVSYNKFFTDEINNLYNSLHDKGIHGKKQISVRKNFGTDNSEPYSAIKKGWIVTKE